MSTTVSKHAQVRMQQRAIPQLVVDCLIRFGRREPAGGGTSKCYFDKRSRRDFEAYAGPLAGRMREFLDVYAVLGSDSEVVTVAHRLERVMRQ